MASFVFLFSTFTGPISDSFLSVSRRFTAVSSLQTTTEVLILPAEWLVQYCKMLSLRGLTWQSALFSSLENFVEHRRRVEPEVRHRTGPYRESCVLVPRSPPPVIQSSGFLRLHTGTSSGFLILYVLSTDYIILCPVSGLWWQNEPGRLFTAYGSASSFAVGDVCYKKIVILLWIINEMRMEVLFKVFDQYDFLIHSA